jgi:hypothetical protein
MISGGDISQSLVVMGMDPRADVFPVPSHFETDERHADDHEKLEMHNEESPRSSQVVAADSSEAHNQGLGGALTSMLYL